MLVPHTSMDQAGDGGITGLVGTTFYLAPELFIPTTVKYSQVQCMYSHTVHVIINMYMYMYILGVLYCIAIVVCLTVVVIINMMYMYILGVLCCLNCCLFDLACFFLPSF